MEHLDKQKGSAYRWTCLSVLLVLLTLLSVIFSLPVYAEESSESTNEIIESTETSVEKDEVTAAGAEADVEFVSVDGTVDEDALLEGYLNQEAGINTSSSSGRRKSPRKNNLSAINQIIYTELKSQIIDVAEGTRSSTEFTISISDTDFTGIIGNTYYTKDDLLAYGLGEDDTLIEDVFVEDSEGEEELDGVKGYYKQAVTKEAANAMTALYVEKFGKRTEVINALLADCPYELYWFDKTTGYSYSPKPSVIGSEAKGLHFVNSSSNFSLAVSVDYQAGSNIYSVDLEKTGSIKTAISNARSVVEQNSSLGDYDKLNAYYTYVNEASAYNSEAASDSYTGGYGDPWQIIYVFDGDDDTKVVCEGYAKAFQYLFYMSSFESDVIDSDIVTGVMRHGDTSGSHMWNVVTMEDNNNYLVDVTNGRFLLGGSGSVSGGYTINGYTTVYSYDDTTIAEYETDELQLSEDDYKYESSSDETGTAVTGIKLVCGDASVETGNTLDYGSIDISSGETITCSAEVVPSDADDKQIYWSRSGGVSISENENGTVVCTPTGNGTAVVAARTSDGGYRAKLKITVYTTVTAITLDQSALVLSIEDSEARSAQLVAAVAPETASDSSVSWSSSNTDVATVDDEGNVTAVAEGTSTITVKAIDGSGTNATCEVAVTRHNLIAVEAKAATCTDQGHIAYWYCSYCKEYFSDDQAIEEIAANDTVIAAMGHTVEKDEAVAATCTETGLTEGSHCSVCGEILVAQKMIEAQGHDWDGGAVTKAATCTVEGVRTYTCKNDSSHKKTETIDATGHTFGAWVTITAATTSAPETQRRMCTVCGKVETCTVGSKLSVEGSTSDKTSVAGSAQIITTSTSEEAPAGSSFSPLALRVSSAKNTSVKIKWNKVSGATGYVVFGAKCGSRMQLLGKTTSTTYTNKKLKKGTYYKYIVTAYQTQTNGTQKVISTSKTIHVVTSGTKYANYKSVKVSKSSKSLKVKKTFKISASAVKKSGKKVKVHRKLRYESSNTGVATVTSSGKVKAVSKGKCTIYVYAQDGTYKTVKITVK